MPVSPVGLDGISADAREAAELKCLGRQRAVRVLVQLSQDVNFALAAGAGTMPPQLFQRHETLATIFPLDRQFLADRLNVQRGHVDLNARLLLPAPATVQPSCRGGCD